MAINPTITPEPATFTINSVVAEAKPTLTPRQLIWRRFRKHRMALLGGVGVLLLMLFIIGGSSFFEKAERMRRIC